MADPRAIVQVSLERDNGLPEDVSVNVTHWEADDRLGLEDRADWDERIVGLMNRIAAFYQDISSYLSSLLSGNGTIRAYDFADPKPRIPRASLDFSFIPSSGSFPAEVAICLSMEADQVPGVNQASRRGRIYLGPVGGNTGQIGAGANDVRVSDLVANTILDAAVTMTDATGGAFALAVFSPTILGRGGSADEAWNDVTSIYIDDAYDTQRRRGGAPTKRTSRQLS